MLICDEFEIPGGDRYKAFHFNQNTNQWEAYWDAPGRRWTIGRGITEYLDNRLVKEGDRLSIEAENQLYIDLFKLNYMPGVRATIPWWDEAPTEVLGGLISLAWNAGIYVFKVYPTTRKIMLTQDYEQIANQIMWINKDANGKRQYGLGARRYTEGKVITCGQDWIGLDDEFKHQLQVWRYSKECKISCQKVGIKI